MRDYGHARHNLTPTAIITGIHLFNQFFSAASPGGPHGSSASKCSNGVWRREVEPDTHFSNRRGIIVFERWCWGDKLNGNRNLKYDLSEGASAYQAVCLSLDLLLID